MYIEKQGKKIKLSDQDLKEIFEAIKRRDGEKAVDLFIKQEGITPVPSEEEKSIMVDMYLRLVEEDYAKPVALEIALEEMENKRKNG